jgi:hypothetical protein
MHDDKFEQELKIFEHDLYLKYKEIFDINISIFHGLSNLFDERVKRLELQSDFHKAINFLYCR